MTTHRKKEVLKRIKKYLSECLYDFRIACKDLWDELDEDNIKKSRKK